MNVLALNFNKLPSPLRSLTGEEREAFESGISPFLLPLDHLSKMIQSIVRDLRLCKEGFYLKLVGTVLGVERFHLSADAQERFIPSLAEYITERGTKRGLEIILSTILGAKDFEIKERSSPFNIQMLNTVITNQRLSNEDDDINSLSIQLSEERKEFKEEDIRSFRKLLALELPPDMTVYLRFKTIETKPTAPEYCAIVGERLA